jgi:hypothetical protein
MSENVNLAPDPNLPPPLRGLTADQCEELARYFLQGVACPRCDWMVAQKELHPSEDDRKNFLRAVLGDGKFSKVYPLYEGKLKLTFSSLNTLQSLLLSELIKQIPDAEPYSRGVEAFRLRLLFYLVGRNDEKLEPPEKASLSFTEAQQLFKERLGQWNEALTALAIRSLQEFTRLETALMEGGLDKPFWKSAGLV